MGAGRIQQLATGLGASELHIIADLADAKARIGDRVFFKGNIDPVHTLLEGTPEQVYADAMQRLEIGSAGSGYVLSSACSVSPRVAPENLAMLPGSSGAHPIRVSGRDGFAELEWIYLSSYYLEPDNEHEYDGHSLVNLRVTSTFGSSWRGTLRLTNLLDVDYAERADYGFGNYRYFVGQPLGAYVEVSYQFGQN